MKRTISLDEVSERRIFVQNWMPLISLRKNLCLATQRPRDIPEGVLSQMGTLVVHRLTNDRDREVVERACGSIDRSASAFLPNLEPGEAAIIGVDFPIPLTIQISLPLTPPSSKSADYQMYWGMLG